jgi:phosphopantetheinyl transferase
MEALRYTAKQYSGIFLHGSDAIPMLQQGHPLTFIVKTRNFKPVHLEKLFGYLNHEERTKCKRFRFQKDRDSYLVVHGLLKLILGKYLEMQARDVQLEYNSFGKPLLSGHDPNIFFNLSHSSDLSALVFDLSNPAGIDIERMNPDFDFHKITRNFFSRDEHGFIHAEREQSMARFYEIWTRKEAILKAVGVGISEHLEMEVYREKSSYHSEDTTRPALPSGRYILNTMKYLDEYMLTTATGHESGDVKVFLLGEENFDFLTD